MSFAAVLMSIKPEYSDLIFSGRKTIELRRVCPKVAQGDLVIVYASGPRMALVGGFEVVQVVSDSPDNLYAKHGESSGVSKETFDHYFSGVMKAYGIQIGKTWLLKEATELRTLRRQVKGFHPPQSYRYLKEIEFAGLILQSYPG